MPSQWHPGCGWHSLLCFYGQTEEEGSFCLDERTGKCQFCASTTPCDAVPPQRGIVGGRTTPRDYTKGLHQVQVPLTPYLEQQLPATSTPMHP